MMSWVRSHLRAGMLLALVALALQLVVGAVHIHPEDFAGSLGVTKVRLAGQDKAPAQPSKPHSGGHDLCMVCASVGLAAAPILSAPPSLAAPLSNLFAWSQTDFTAELPDRASALFRARAPPV